MGRKKKEAITVEGITSFASTTAAKTVVVSTKAQVYAALQKLAVMEELGRHRLDILEGWQNEVNYKTKHYDDLDNILSDTIKAQNELVAWQREVKDTWRRQPIVQETAKNQDVARLEGLLTTYEQKVESYIDRLLRIERKYIFPDSYKPATTDEANNIITDSITAIENKIDKYTSRVTNLEDSNQKLRHQADTAAKVLADVRVIKEKLGLDATQ